MNLTRLLNLLNIPKLTSTGVKLWSTIRNFPNSYFTAGSSIAILDKAGLAHILGRHHPSYFIQEGSKTVNTMFLESTSISDIVNLIDQVIKSDPAKVEKLMNGVSDVYSGTFNLNKKKYRLGFRPEPKGSIGQFFEIK